MVYYRTLTKRRDEAPGLTPRTKRWDETACKNDKISIFLWGLAAQAFAQLNKPSFPSLPSLPFPSFPSFPSLPFLFFPSLPFLPFPSFPSKRSCPDPNLTVSQPSDESRTIANTCLKLCAKSTPVTAVGKRHENKNNRKSLTNKSRNTWGYNMKLSQ